MNAALPLPPPREQTALRPSHLTYALGYITTSDSSREPEAGTGCLQPVPVWI